MLAFFSIVPMGGGTSVGAEVADAIKVVADSGLDYQVTAMGTLVEGDWDEVMGVIRACYERMSADCERITCSIKIDARRGPGGRLSSKVQKVQDDLGRTLET